MIETWNGASSFILYGKGSEIATNDPLAACASGGELTRARINSMTRPPDVKEIEQHIATIHAEKEAAIKAQDYENSRL